MEQEEKRIVMPDYSEGFRCIAGKCRHSCCIGWEIDIDEKTYEKYRTVSGPIGEKLRTCICEELREKGSSKDTYMTVEELCAYHPDHPSHQTVRRWKRLGYIPFYKDDETRRVKFKKSEIDAWIASSRHMSREERNALRDAKILAQRRQMEIGGLDDE